MKKKFFTLFSATLATLALALLSSCSGITSPSGPETATAHQAEGLSLRGTFSMAEATAEPSLKTITPSSSQRNAIPDIGDLAYSVKAYRPSDGATKWADVNPSQKSYVFNNTLSAGTWQITAYANQEGNDTPIMQSQTVTATLSKDRPDTSANLALAPSTERSGDIALTVRWASGTGISWVTYSCHAFSTGENQGSGYENSYTLSDFNVAAGIYPITISFYKDRGSTIPLYSCTEYIAVYPGLTTNQWTKSTAPHISSGGQFLVTADCVKTFVYRSVYLSSSGDNTTANGTSERPYKTAEAAMARLTELAATSIYSINETTPWELHVVGTIKATSIPGNAFIDVPSSIGFLKIVGEGSGATLDADQKGRVLYVQSNANVKIQDITLKNGSTAEDGGGVYVANNASFTVLSGSTITGNTAKDGGGIYANCKSLGINYGSIKGNTASGQGNNVYIKKAQMLSGPSGNGAYFDDSTSSNGKADAVCLNTNSQFARFNNPGSGSTDFQSFIKNSGSIFNTGYAANFYLGNTTDTAEKTWTASETIYPGLNLTITCASTANDVKAKIKPSSIITLNLVNNSKNLTLKKIILQGSSDVRCIASSGGSLTLENSTLTGSTLNNQGAGLFLTGGSASFDENSSVTACDISSHENCNGGGISVNGSGASLDFSGKIYDCAAVKGGGIYLKGGTVTLKDNAVIGKSVTSGNPASTSASGINKAMDGAGVYVESGTFKMEGNSKVSYNYAGIGSGNKHGGGIYVAGGTVTIGTSSSSTASVCNNTSDSRGGGISVTGGKVELYGSIKYNVCGNGCGGVELEGGNLDTFSGSVISNNGSGTSGYSGNGVIINADTSKLHMYGGSIKQNSSYDVSIEAGNLYLENDATAERVTKNPSVGFIYVGTLTSNMPATITPVNGFNMSSTLNYDTNKQIVYQLGSSNLAAACAKFAVANDASGNAWTIGDDGKLHTIIQQSSGEINIGSSPTYVGGAYSTEIYITTSNNNITLKNLTKPSVANHSALTLNAASGNINATIYLTGTNSLTASNHGGIKFTGPAGRQINLTFNTTSSGTLSFDSTSHKDIQIENVNYTISIASGLSFTGRVGTTTYTDATAFFNAAKNSTAGSTFTITKQ